MATALANVSDDWVQRAFAAELGGKRVGGGAREALSNIRDHLNANAVVKLIMIWLFFNTISIISVTASKKFNGKTPKNNGQTKGLGGGMLFMSFLEILLYSVIYAMLALQIGEMEGRIAQLILVISALMLASVSCGLHVAILLHEKRYNQQADQFFNSMRVIFFIGIAMCFIMTFPEFEGKEKGVGAALGCIALFIFLASVLKKKTLLVMFAFVAAFGMFCLVIGTFTFLARS